MLRRIAFFIFSLLFCAHTQAQNFSYVYIQGDKQTPFYVKMEDEMLPRFGKNYSIISELAPGPIKLEILFQQNVYPPQRFVVNVPENGSRGFLLMQKNGGFSLYDLQQQFYLPAGNKLEDDHLPEAIKEPEPQGPPPATTEPVTEKKEPAVAKAAPVKTPKISKPAPVVPKPKVKTPPAKPATGDPVFIDDIELKTERTGNTLPAGGVAKNKLAIINSDCPKAISNDDFSDIYRKAVNKPTSGKLKYLLGQLDNCYTSNQVRQLTQVLSGDDERFTFLKRAYAHVTDQSYFATLENMLSAPEWKEYFRNMLQH